MDNLFFLVYFVLLLVKVLEIFGVGVRGRRVVWLGYSGGRGFWV